MVDLGRLVGYDYRRESKEAAIIILKTSKDLSYHISEGLIDDDTCEDAIGLYVDQINEMVTATMDEVDVSPANVDLLSKSMTEGILRKDNQITVLLKVSEVLLWNKTEVVE